MTRREDIVLFVRKIPLFWKVLVLVLVVAGIPLGIAISTSLTGAAATAENLISKNLLQLSDRVSERLSYTMVSIEGDLEVLEEVPRKVEDYKAFALAQRRELYGGEGESRKRFSVPKYLEVGWHDANGVPGPLIYKDEVVSNVDRKWNENIWCDEGDFVDQALSSPGKVVVSGMLGCPLTERSYSPGEGLLGQRVDGGIRVSAAVVGDDGTVEGVVSLVLAEMHLTWALLSLEEKNRGENLWAMVVDHEGRVISHPNPERILPLGTRGKKADSWEAGGGWFIPDLIDGHVDDSLSEMWSQVKSGASATGQIVTGKDHTWMVAVEPVNAEFGIYDRSSPFASVWVFYPREAVIAEWLKLATQYAILLGITAIVALIGSVLLARNLSDPIQRLSIAAGEIAQGQEPEIPAIDRGDEVGELARSFQQMQTDLQVHQEALMRSERLAAVGTFVAGIVHETKNVLAGVGNYLTLLDRRFKGDPVREEVIAPMRRALDQLDTLTLRMRELALTPRFTTTDLVEVLRHALELVEHQGREEDISFQCDFGSPVFLTKADGSLLGQVFLNLILNAVQASSRGGEIRISVDYDGSKAIVGVRDQGSGFPEDLLEEVFKPFVTTKAGGTGLGLYISRSIVLRHGGDLTLSNHPDGGALVEVTLVHATDESQGMS